MYLSKGERFQLDEFFTHGWMLFNGMDEVYNMENIWTDTCPNVEKYVVLKKKVYLCGHNLAFLEIYTKPFKKFPTHLHGNE